MKKNHHSINTNLLFFLKISISFRASNVQLLSISIIQDGLIIENIYDRPWLLSGEVGSETTAAMSVACDHVRRICPNIPIGVQVLSAANKQALAIAKATG